MPKHAILRLENGTIKLTMHKDGAVSIADGIDATQEGLAYAAGVLGRVLSLPYKDPAKECRRIHEEETLRSTLSSLVDDYYREIRERKDI